MNLKIHNHSCKRQATPFRYTVKKTVAAYLKFQQRYSGVISNIGRLLSRTKRQLSERRLRNALVPVKVFVYSFGCIISPYIRAVNRYFDVFIALASLFSCKE